MTNDDLKKLLKDVKELVEVVNHKIDKVETNQSIYPVLNSKLDSMDETLEDHTSRLGALAGDTEQLLMDVKAIKDGVGLWHQRDKRELDEIKRQLDLPVIPDIPQI